MREYRYMRTIIFFDLPTLTATQRRNYRTFVKKIKALGFFMMQESVYVKMSINDQYVESTLKSVRQFLPKEGSIFSLTITEKQFASMEFMVGAYKTEVLETDERIIEL